MQDLLRYRGRPGDTDTAMGTGTWIDESSIASGQLVQVNCYRIGCTAPIADGTQDGFVADVSAYAGQGAMENPVGVAAPLVTFSPAAAEGIYFVKNLCSADLHANCYGLQLDTVQADAAFACPTADPSVPGGSNPHRRRTPTEHRPATISLAVQATTSPFRLMR